MSGVIGQNPNMRSGVIGDFDSQAETWILTGGTTSTGNITSSLARFSGQGTNYAGPGMTQSSGVFTFPSTGLWEVTSTAGFYSFVYQNYVSMNIHTTTNGSSYALAAVGYVTFAPDGSNNINGHVHVNILFGVKNTADYKVIFNWDRQNAAATLRGSSTYLDTSFCFRKVAPAGALIA